MKLSSREQEVADHLKACRPKMYWELVKSGKLEETAHQMWEEYTNQLATLVSEKGLPYNQAQELCQEIAFPPTEQDQPHLGEDPTAKDPTSATTTKSPKATPSEKVASALKPNKT
jgi:hypothetical protein